MKRLMIVIALSLIGFANGRADDQLHARSRYVLRPGDVLDLAYRLTPEFNQTVTVQPDGFVNLDIVGDVRLAGLTVDQAHDQIIEKAGKRLNNPELNLVLKDFNKPYVVVAGEVDKPGRYDLREDTTALQAIMLAGGFKASGYDTNVYLFRKINGDEAMVKKLNLHNVKKTADLERDMMLQPGDMLLVPRNKLENVSRVIKAVNLGLYFDPYTF
jgi:polysaccharide export outer membrane protein